jgi:hypothetical protein
MRHNLAKRVRAIGMPYVIEKLDRILVYTGIQTLIITGYFILVILRRGKKE